MADVVVVKSVTSEDARCVFRSTMQDFAQLIPAKLTRVSRPLSRLHTSRLATIRRRAGNTDDTSANRDDGASLKIRRVA